MAASHLAEAERTKADVQSAVESALAEQQRLFEEAQNVEKAKREAEKKKISDENDKIIADQ